MPLKKQIKKKSLRQIITPKKEILKKKITKRKILKKKNLREKPVKRKNIVRKSKQSLPKKINISFKQLPKLFIQAFLFLIPTILFLSIVPLGVIYGSSLAQEALQTTNFVFTPSTLEVLSSPQETKLRQTTKGITNILIIGIDTRNAYSRLLNTDTIILASFNHSKNKLTLISLPRDLLIPFPEYGYGKINSVYATGEARKNGSGMTFLKKTIEQSTGQPIHYYGMIDLQGFTKVITLLDGITVNVENSFTDYYYPHPNGISYQTVSFKKGKQKMNGDQALKYSRSRHSIHNNEGSDFARARRQQIIITSLIDKFNKTDTLQNPLKIYQILKAMVNNVKTSALSPSDVQAGMNLLKTDEPLKINKIVLDPSVANFSLIVRGNVMSTYHIMPRKGPTNWTAIKTYLAKQLN